MPATTSLPIDTECLEQERLLAKYVAATSDYSRMAIMLSTKSYAMSKVEYTLMQREYWKARALAEAAHIALEEHVLVHGCGARVVS